MGAGQIILNGLTSDEFMDQLGELISKRVQQAICNSKKEELQERFLSPSEVCKMFVPKISRQTLSNWTKDGSLQKHIIGRSVYYKYSEVIEAVKAIKRFKTQ